MTLAEEKTQLSHIYDGFDFLAVNIKKSEQTLLIQPASQKVRGVLLELKASINSCVALPTDIFIRRLNSTLRGWAQSYRQVVAKKVFAWVDYCAYHYFEGFGGTQGVRHRRPSSPVTAIQELT